MDTPAGRVAGAGGKEGWGPGMGALVQAASTPTITTLDTQHRSRFMGLILLEAFGAMLVLVLIVWWTMFSGRKGGELPPTGQAEDKTSTSHGPDEEAR